VNKRRNTMTMVTINDTEYNTDDFTEDQKVSYNEILFATNLVNNLNYQLQCVKTMQATVVNRLTNSLNNEGEDNVETETV
tara:strand:- start:1075 stop:1314 length:240 start_codon:yes stop_codon:yes gene_type:complete